MEYYQREKKMVKIKMPHQMVLTIIDKLMTVMSTLTHYSLPSLHSYVLFQQHTLSTAAQNRYWV